MQTEDKTSTKQKDIIHRFIFDKTDIRGEIVALQDSYTQAFEHQDFHPSLRPVFGEFLAGAALLSEVLKFEGTLTLQAKGDGPVNVIMAEATHDGDIRGIVRILEPEHQGQDFTDVDLMFVPLSTGRSSRRSATCQRLWSSPGVSNTADPY